jgi:hypothetical protein
MAETNQNNIQAALEKSVDYIKVSFEQSAEYIKSAFTQNGAPKAEKTFEKSAESSTTYTEMGVHALEAVIDKALLPAAALCADVPVLVGTIAAATLATCVLNLAGIGIKSGATYIAGEKAEWFNDSINSGLDCFNENIVRKTVDLCLLEHKVLWCMQGLVGQGLSTLVNNIEDPSSIMEAGKTAANLAVGAWDSVKCGCEYAYSFMASEKAGCAGESSEVPSE